MLDFVMTNYNNSDVTGVALESISLLGERVGRVVVVDNASRDAERHKLELLEDKYEFLDVVYQQENVGYFPGLNVGLAYLQSNRDHLEWVYIGNNDVEFPLEFCDQIDVNLHLADKYPVISPNIVTLDGIHQNPHVIEKISKLREFVYDVYFLNYYFAKAISWFAHVTRSFTDRSDELQHNVGQEIYQGHGAGYVLTPLFFQNFKQLWAPTFLMGEEFFLSKQLSDKGMCVYYEPTISMVHHYHAAMKEVPSKQVWKFGRDAHKEYRKYVKLI